MTHRTALINTDTEGLFGEVVDAGIV